MGRDCVPAPPRVDGHTVRHLHPRSGYKLLAHITVSSTTVRTLGVVFFYLWQHLRGLKGSVICRPGADTGPVSGSVCQGPRHHFLPPHWPGWEHTRSSSAGAGRHPPGGWFGSAGLSGLSFGLWSLLMNIPVLPLRQRPEAEPE